MNIFYVNRDARGGFTLIELLVVIAIIAVLSVVVVLALNPAELIKQARDSNRISDLSTIKTAISLYLTDVSGPSIASTTATSSPNGYNYCFLSTTPSASTGSAKCGVFVSGHITATSAVSAVNLRNVDATGWLPVNLRQISIGSPLGGALPIDPVNNKTYYYSYAASSTLVFELDAFIESNKYGLSGAKDVVSRDGGDNSQTFEAGNAPGLGL